MAQHRQLVSASYRFDGGSLVLFWASAWNGEERGKGKGGSMRRLKGETCMCFRLGGGYFIIYSFNLIHSLTLSHTLSLSLVLDHTSRLPSHPHSFSHSLQQRIEQNTDTYKDYPCTTALPKHLSPLGPSSFDLTPQATPSTPFERDIKASSLYCPSPPSLTILNISSSRLASPHSDPGQAPNHHIPSPPCRPPTPT
ncbi:hypothetical protein BD324DRAFT_475999 [Kockovaella imperatae]|uniref:Uncharacterized protein n=1 Tax=Kockovaella imperatae TaxID=4999 RepID=A0A1Y1UFX2_9TREE|nr:hypothetical protein BD324DRAFT_475999 [Kockovaella imperatae]ORX36879.1 hypothetical protein BD324DRAFT_475999 [Kockovaella imperatae]